MLEDVPALAPPQQKNTVRHIRNKAAEQRDWPHRIRCADRRISNQDRLLSELLSKCEGEVQHRRHHAAEDGKQDRCYVTAFIPNLVLVAALSFLASYRGQSDAHDHDDDAGQYLEQSGMRDMDRRAKEKRDQRAENG